MKIFYRPEMVAKQSGYSPSSAKPKLVVNQWTKLFGSATDIVSFEPVTIEQLCDVHSERFVKGVFKGDLQNGFGTTDLQLANSLLYTSGSMVAAALHAIKTEECAASPTSGFHHASYARPAGFCTFNGLIVTADAVRKEYPEAVVSILDADMHYGDGTDQILDFSPRPWIRHVSIGKTMQWPSQADPFLLDLPNIIQGLVSSPAPVVLLYQAGADPHIDDPQGGWLTDAQLYQRDKIVFTECKKHGIPVAWNLAGGYQTPVDKVVDIHCNTFKAALEVYA